MKVSPKASTACWKTATWGETASCARTAEASAMAATTNGGEYVLRFIALRQDWSHVDLDGLDEQIRTGSFLVLTSRAKPLDGERLWWTVIHHGKRDSSIFRASTQFDEALLHLVAVRREVDINEARHTVRAALRVLTPSGSADE